ncbi:hypothetical protein [Gracilibacillus sp. YIM 98692]|uniref:hypothetical protein n=1 Tax=Gracilibacillus sp. YIM 98692 TaxID=2663532 RepID=UPI0013D4909F|nr:hypothetical protein [Gracilibacillus sp. YIM 98692]
MKRWQRICGAGIVIPIFLIGCSDAVVENTEKMMSNEKSEQVQESGRSNKVREGYKKGTSIQETNEPAKEILEEAAAANQVETKKVITDLEVEETDAFTDPEEFAKYASKVIFLFQNGEIDAQTYFRFVQNHGSTQMKEQFPDNLEQATVVFNTLQSMFEEKGRKGGEYLITDIGFTENRQEGYYYRLVRDGDDELYYISTIKYEDGSWKFHDDGPSPSFEEEQKGILDEKELQNQ